MAFVPAHWKCDLCHGRVEGPSALKMVPTRDSGLTASACVPCLEKRGWTDEKRRAALDAQYEALFGRKPATPHE